VRIAYMARWPGLDRSVSGLECAYYRTNSRLPVTTPDGLLVLLDPSEVELGEIQEEQQQGGDGASTGASDNDHQQQPSEEDVRRRQQQKEKELKYNFYRGVPHRTRAVKVRSARISLMERYPEELVDEANDWVREEHRVWARGAGEFF
jgi:hypothetical protein